MVLLLVTTIHKDAINTQGITYALYCAKVMKLVAIYTPGGCHD